MRVLNLVAVYDDRSVAEEARHKLMADGIPEADIRVSADTGEGTPGRVSTASREQESGGFFSWLFGMDDVSDDDRSWYGHNLEKRTAVSVRVDESEAQRVRDILDSSDPVDIGMGMGTSPVTTPAMTDRSGPSVPATSAPMTDGDEQVIPLAKEQLDVGKEAVETRHRVRTYVVERPVEKTVPLRDERVVVERRPVSGEPSAMSGADLQGREFEVVERREQPVVDKKAAATEEAVVRREAEERMETVRETVREMEIDDESTPHEDPGQKR